MLTRHQARIATYGLQQVSDTFNYCHTHRHTHSKWENKCNCLDTQRSPAHQARIANNDQQQVSDTFTVLHKHLQTHTQNVQTNITAWTHHAHSPTKITLPIMFMASSRFQICLVRKSRIVNTTVKQAPAHMQEQTKT